MPTLRAEQIERMAVQFDQVERSRGAVQPVNVLRNHPDVLFASLQLS